MLLFNIQVSSKYFNSCKAAEVLELVGARVKLHPWKSSPKLLQRPAETKSEYGVKHQVVLLRQASGEVSHLTCARVKLHLILDTSVSVDP